MGAVLAKFRKVKSTTEELEAIQAKISELEKYTYNTQEQKKRIVGNFVAISIGVYVIAFLVFYFVYFPPTWKERFIYSAPLLIFPLVIIFLRKLFTWYYQRKLNKNNVKLMELQGQKKKILEQVMDKETYKVAVNLLARFGEKPSTNIGKYPYGTSPLPTGSTSKQLIPQPPKPLTPIPNNQLSGAPGLNIPGRTAYAQMQSPVLGRSPGMNPTAPFARINNTSPVARPTDAVGLRRRTPFPILAMQDKGVFERILDVLVGDGPHDRFAMICKECHAHNGMAPKEDFEYTTFHCAFCNALNPSRKSRPVAPPLNLEHTATLNSTLSSDSSSSEDESEPHQTLLNPTENNNHSESENENEIKRTEAASVHKPVAGDIADDELEHEFSADAPSD